jgi:hypothetical protein
MRLFWPPAILLLRSEVWPTGADREAPLRQGRRYRIARRSGVKSRAV